MSVQETVMWDTDTASLKKVEDTFLSFLDRQSTATKQSAAKSAKQAVGEYEKAAKSAGKAGKTWADGILDELNATLKTKQAQIKEAFGRSAFDRKEMRKMNQDARREFDQGILKALDQMKAKGEANQEEYLKLARALKGVGPAASQGAQQATKEVGLLGRAVNGLKSMVLGATVAFAGLFALGRLRQFAQETLDLAQQAADSATRQAAVWERNAGHVGRTFAEIQRFSLQMQRETLFQADELDLAISQLLTYKSISTDAFERTIKLGGDMASVYGGMERSVEALARALDDPIRGLGQLRKAGFTFEDSVISQIKTLTEQNRIYEAQRIILSELEAEVGGVAAAMKTGWTAQLDDAAKKWERIKIRFGEIVAIPVAKSILGIADALLEVDTPLERTIQGLERLGVAAELLLTTKLAERVEGLKDTIKELEEEIANATIATGTRNIGVTGYGTAVDKVNIGEMSAAELLKMRNDFERELEEQLERLDRATATRNASEASSAQVVIARLRGQIETIDGVTKGRQRLQDATDDLTAAESQLADARAKNQTRRDLNEVNRQISELESLGEASDETAEKLKELAAQRAELEKKLAAPAVVTPRTVTEDEISEADKATKALQKSMRELQLAGELGLHSLKDASGEVRQALQGLLSVNEQIATAEEQIAAIRAAGMAVPPGAQAYLDHLREVQAELRQVAEQEIERWQRELPEAVAEIHQSLRGVVSIMLPMEGGARTLDAAMAGVAERTRSIATAEAELRRAQMARDPARVARAEKELAEAREDLAEFTARLMVALEAAGLPAEELEEIIARLQEYLQKGGAETKKVEGRFASLGKHAQTIAGLARGVLSVADAMGVLDDQTRRTLDAAVNLGDGIAKIAASGGKDIGAWAQSIGSIVQLGAGLFGSDPEAKKRAEEMKRSMERLTDALWELNQSIVRESTRQMERDRDAARRGLESIEGSRHISQAGGIAPWAKQGVINELARDMGLTTEKGQAATDALRRWAKEMDGRYNTGGILSGFIEQGDIKGFREALRELIPGIEDQIGRAGAFGDDPAGVIARVNFELDILGETDAAERLRAVVEALKDAGHEAGEFQAALDELASLDLDTPEGRERRDQLVREMTEALVRGGADLGELNKDQLQDLIRGWAEASPGPGVSRSVQIGTSITEVQANEVIAWLEDIAYTLREIRDGRTIGAPAPDLARDIESGLRDLIAGLAAQAQAITPDMLQAMASAYFDFRGAQFGGVREQDLDEWLRDVRAEVLRRDRGAF